MNKTSIWTPEFLAQCLQRADPLADNAVARIVENNGSDEALRLFSLLIRNIEMPVSQLPAEVGPFLVDTRALPVWADAPTIADAHRFFLDHGPKALFLLYFKSLPLLYSLPKGAVVLVRTSRLTNEDQSLRIFARRIAETGQFMVDVMAPGELTSGGRGITSIQKVRLIHASIRHFLQAEGWDTNELGQPINQLHMAMTLMSFSIAVLDGLAQFGIEVPEAWKEAYMHAWRAIGHNLGIVEELLPNTAAEGRYLMQQILHLHAEPSEEGQLLTKSLVDFTQNLLRSEKAAPAPEAIIYYLLGEQYANMLGVHPNLGCLSAVLPHAIRTTFRLGERLEDKVQGPLSGALDFLSKKTVQAMVGYFDNFKGRHFQIPKVMEEAWL